MNRRRFIQVARAAALGTAVATWCARTADNTAIGRTRPAERGHPDDEPNRDDLHERVVKLTQQLQHMQKQSAQLEPQTTAKRDERSPDVAFLAKRFQYRIPFETGRTQTR